MVKLKGKAKAAFLKRMSLGRKNAAKKTKSKPKQLKKVTKRVTKRRKSTTINKTKPRRKTMVSRRKRYSGRARSGGLKIGNSLKTGIIGEVVKGIGAGSLVGMVLGRVMPDSNLTPIASTGAAFLAGGLTGGIAQVVLSGGLSSFGGMFGGNQNVTAQVEAGV
jgi:hypothetical protein